MSEPRLKSGQLGMSDLFVILAIASVTACFCSWSVAYDFGLLGLWWSVPVWSAGLWYYERAGSACLVMMSWGVSAILFMLLLPVLVP